MFPILYCKSKNDKIKEWQITVKELPNKTAELKVLSGYEDGKKTEHITIIEKGKNIGKKNETTPFEQAISQAQKKFNDKQEKEGFSPDKKNMKVHISPMLAETYKFDSKVSRKKDIVFPCYAQPKIDGWRCIATLKDDKVILLTRKGKEYNGFNTLKSVLYPFLKERSPTFYLDGEIFTNKLPFETFSGLCNKQKCNEEEEQLKNTFEYWLFDCFDLEKPNWGFTDRLNETRKLNHNLIVHIENVECENKVKAKELHDKYFSEGFEGLMLRNKNSTYQLNTRSRDLQKYKCFMEEEFPIIGFKEGVGDEKGCIIWECSYPGGSFTVRPVGTREYRAELYKDAQKDFSKYEGKPLTVKFQNKMVDGCPRFVVGKSIRYELI